MPGLDDRAILVSTDGHISPPISETRRYCPKEHLDDFDAWAKTQGHAAFFRDYVSKLPPKGAKIALERFDDGPEHYNMDFRLQEMDKDGVACEVTFHGSVNDGPMPFNGGLFTTEANPLGDLGLHIYNAWLADAISIAPERFVGLAQVPMQDISAAVKEVEWASDAGLKGVNFPAPRPGITPYDAPEWEPFWATCEERGILLATHSGAFTGDPFTQFWFVQLESGGWPNRKGLARMIFGGVFEKHPELNIMLTENTGLINSWVATMAEWDSLWTHYPKLQEDFCPNKPSSYAAKNIYIGASFLAPFEAKLASENGYTDRVCWGRDFPHPEGTWSPNHIDDDVRYTHLQLRHALAEIPSDEAALMAGENAIRACKLDRDVLAKVAENINAPTLRQLAEPLEVIPEDGGFFSFRQEAFWA